MVNNSETTPFLACFSQPPELPRKVLHINRRDVAGGHFLCFSRLISFLLSPEFILDTREAVLVWVVLLWGYKTHIFRVNHMWPDIMSQVLLLMGPTLCKISRPVASPLLRLEIHLRQKLLIGPTCVESCRSFDSLFPRSSF